MNGKQGGDAAKLAAALVTLSESDAPPVRFAAGADAVAAFESKADALRAQADAHLDLSSSLAIDLIEAVSLRQIRQLTIEARWPSDGVRASGAAAAGGALTRTLVR
jgi:hypothetical protein